MADNKDLPRDQSTPEDEIKQAFKNDYPLIPMKDITDEARMIAVAWMECGDKNWIGQKHKLASDIMNYARRQSLSEINSLKEKLERAKETLQEAMDSYNEHKHLLHFDVNKIRTALSDLNKTNDKP